MIPALPRQPWPTLTKGHGTGNDFVLFTDAEAAIDLDAATVAALADRHRGIGADGVIRVVRGDALAKVDDGVARLLREEADGGRVAEWFMDYRNADGSIAQMCGNGSRVFVRYLLAEGLVSLRDGEGLMIGTRAGVLEARIDGENIAVEMGPFTIPSGPAAVAAGWDTQVEVAQLVGQRPGLSVTMPNPHVVIAVASQAELDGLDLTSPPVVSPVPAEGTNVEIVHVLGESTASATLIGELAMRVHERGVGETLSCGTGACAAAVAARAWAGPGSPDVWRVRVPGGALMVRLLPGDQVELVGPAELVATIQLR